MHNCKILTHLNVWIVVKHFEFYPPEMGCQALPCCQDNFNTTTFNEKIAGKIDELARKIETDYLDKMRPRDICSISMGVANLTWLGITAHDEFLVIFFNPEPKLLEDGGLS